MVDLKAKPFYLDDEAIKWVEETIEGMSIERKNWTTLLPGWFFN